MIRHDKVNTVKLFYPEKAEKAKSYRIRKNLSLVDSAFGLDWDR